MPLHNHIPWVHILTGERRTLIFWPELKHAVVGESVLVQLLFGVVSSADGDQLDVSGTEEPQQRRKPYILTGVLFWVLFIRQETRTTTRPSVLTLIATMLRFHVTLSLTLGFLSAVTSANTSKRRDEFVETILMPDAVSDSPDTLMCTSRKLAPEETYITKFIPHATKDTAHHMVVFGCEIPASNSSLWSCNGYESTTPSENAVCGLGDRQILFAWAMDAPEKTLPEGVGLRVSGATRLNYLVVQMHYAKAFPPGVTDSSGISLTMTRTRPPQQLGYYILGNWGFIPPQKTDYHMDSFCKFDRNFTIYPIGYRTHSHNLGVVTSGYRIRDGEWLEIGRMSPQLPQTFYPVTYPGIDIRPGDLLASRCTMNSMDRTSDTPLGATNHDEMCNFYIMYSTYEQGNLSNVYCFEDSRSYSWLKTFRPEEIPRNSGLLDGIPGADFVRHKFKML